MHVLMHHLVLLKRYCCGLTQQLAARTRQPLSHSSPATHWDGEENGQKVKLVG